MKRRSAEITLDCAAFPIPSLQTNRLLLRIVDWPIRQMIHNDDVDGALLLDTSPLRKGETVEVRRLASEDTCASHILVLIRWRRRKMAVSLSQLDALDPEESTKEAVGDWHCWLAQSYLF